MNRTTKEKAFDLEAFLALKKRTEQQQRQLDRAEGHLAALLAQLREDYGLASFREAELRLAELQEALGWDEQEHQRLLGKLREEHGERWGGN